MNAAEDAGTGQADTTTGQAADRIDRALTVGGYSRATDGRYLGSTAKLYAACWGQFESWCRSAGRTPMPATPETIAVFAAHLIDDEGFAAGTVRGRISAIRARHRQLGEPVPDNVAAWSVLRGANPTRRRPEVKGIRREDLLRVAEICRSGPMGTRNRAIALLAWDLLIPAPDFIGLNIGDIGEQPTGDGDGTPSLVVRADLRTLVITPDPVEALCPVRAALAWVGCLRAAGITAGPLFRPVDSVGVIAGSGLPRRGCSNPSGRLSVRSVYRIWTKMVAEAGVSPCTPRSLRIGGAQDLVQRGAEVTEVLQRADWSERSPTVVNRLVM